MNIEQRQWSKEYGWTGPNDTVFAQTAQLVFVFGGRMALEVHERFLEVRERYPSAQLLLCSTAGEILGTNVYDDTIAVTAVHFAQSEILTRSLKIEAVEQSYETGKRLVESFPPEGLRHLFVVCVGQKINGSELVRGLNEQLPAGVSVTGGLAGDGARFERTVVGLNGVPSDGNIAAVGFYGSALQIHFGSFGGWDSFGLDRKITKAKNNILYELDGQPALDLYKKYLGDQSANLPGSALLFPLSIKVHSSDEPVVRTILSIDEENKSMIFAGDMPVGAYARLMKANFDRLIEGSAHAAQNSVGSLTDVRVDLAVLISCVGRKLVLGQRIEEEVEQVREVFGDTAVLSGFYSYGEISPLSPTTKCELQNQTMTITTFSER
jgi:hypothetical protein